jgi:[acyl-carrier-protein] S-malonyltransferase
MGNSLYENSLAAKKIFDAAGEEIKEWCFNGTKEMLRMTKITQPSIYTVTMAAYVALLEELEKWNINDIEIVGMAGFSLGEYAALTAAGSIDDYKKGIGIVTKRGQWMNEAGLDQNGEPLGGMMAAFGERHHILECVDLCREDGILEGVNFNSPSQTVIAGSKDALERFKRKAKELGHIKAIPLSVSTAFHSSMMLPSVEKLKKLLIEENLHQPIGRIYSNVTGKLIEENADMAELMAKQAMSPVYWQETIESMLKDGVELFIEIGPGTTLSGIVNKINHEINTAHVQDMDSLEHTIGVLKGEIQC